MRISAFLCLCSLLVGRVPAQSFGIDAKRVYPVFTVGVTGIRATIEKGRVTTVATTLAGSPSAGKFKPGDILVAAGGMSLTSFDPRRQLGQALGAAEAKGGMLRFEVLRAGKRRKITIKIPVLGAYGKTWGVGCAKSKIIVKQTVDYLLSIQNSEGAFAFGGKRANRDGLQACLAGLFLLSLDEPKLTARVRRQVHGLAAKVTKRSTTSTWQIGYQGILIAEYFLKTGDRQVLAGLKTLCDQAIYGQAAGGWGHGPDFGPGYVQSGLMNSAGVPVLTALLLARECGVKVDPDGLARALKLFYRMVGHGHVPYGDHRSELWWPNTNGRNGKLACALSLLDEPRFKSAAQHLAMLVTDSYYAPEFGHTGGGFNVIWRGLGSVHVDASHQDDYQRQMRELAWYYDLTRMPAGGFSMPPSVGDITSRYCGVEWGTGAIGLAYTAPRRSLRITGARRSEHSVKFKAPKLEWGTKADLKFFAGDVASGFGEETAQPPEIYELLLGKTKRKRKRKDKNKNKTGSFEMTPVPVCAKYLRHANPAIRSWAARALMVREEEAAVDALAVAAAHDDPRVRRAAYDAVSGYDNWSAPKQNKLSRQVVSSRFLPAILKTLHDPASAWWEVDGALFALGRAEVVDIRKHWKLITRFARHEEWYIRQAAFWAIVGLRKEITADEFQLMADIYRDERHVYARSSYDSGFKTLIRKDRVQLDSKSEARLVKTLGLTLHSAPIAEGYDERGVHEAAHRTMMILKHFDKRVYAQILDDLVSYLKIWQPGMQHSQWLIVGSKWQPGLIEVSRSLGDGAKILMRALEGIVNKIEPGSRDKKDIAVRVAVQKAVKDFGSDR